jgi:hypothetical protein
MMDISRRITLMISLILLAITALAVYTKITETKAWIFGDSTYGTTLPENVIHLTPEELSRYPTVKAYIDYIASGPGVTPLKSMSIDPLEARSLMFYLSLRSSYYVQIQNGGSLSEWYVFSIDVGGQGYGVNIVFSNDRPVLD